MTISRNNALIGFALVLGLVYFTFFRGCSEEHQIQILTQSRPIPGKRPMSGSTYPVSFGLDRSYRLKLIKVVDADEYATNKYAHTLWHLVGDSTSSPLKAFMYGEEISGMKPAIPNAQAEPLMEGVPYLLLIEARRAKGQIPFFTREVTRSNR